MTPDHIAAIEERAKGETGPLYGVELIESLPIGGGMRQSMPDRADLEKAAKINQRVVAGYEVALARVRELEGALRFIRDTWDDDDINMSGIQIAHDMKSTAAARLANA